MLILRPNCCEYEPVLNLWIQVCLVFISFVCKSVSVLRTQLHTFEILSTTDCIHQNTDGNSFTKQQQKKSEKYSTKASTFRAYIWEYKQWNEKYAFNLIETQLPVYRLINCYWKYKLIVTGLKNKYHWKMLISINWKFCINS